MTSKTAAPCPPAADDAALRRQRQHKLNALITMAAGLAHDFNNHLTAILGNNSIVLRHLSAQASSRKNAAQIEASALQALELANQLQLFTGRVRPNLAVLDLSAALREMQGELRALMAREVALEFRLADALPPVKADVQQLRRVVMNLLMNANDAMADRRGTVAVSTGVMECDAEGLEVCDGADRLAPGRYVFVEVADEGAGMSAETRERIFDPFFSTKIRGKGMGLPVALGIMRAHGGALRVDSQPERGCAVRALLPALPAAPTGKV